jgi:glutathione synthase/RimK-type ligase-like ATP-grasp enzyme
MRVALVTDDNAPALSQSDSELVTPLRAQGIEPLAISWQRADVDWTAYDAVILRACWNYHAHIDAYRAWLAALEHNKVNVWNRVKVARWDMDKLYLRDLAARGIPIPPTVWLERDAQVNLRQLLQAQDWLDAVVKPRIGASASHIWRVTREEADTHQARFDELLATREGGWMVQQFLPEIAQGEWSFVFFQAEFSHAAFKRPAADNIFVQPRFGGSSVPATPPEFFVEQARAVLDVAAECLACTPRDFLYARVDAIPRGEQMLLLELEVMEPGLFLNYDSPGACERFADAIAQII